MNDHERIAELLPLHAAGQLDDAGRSEVERHLETCAECRAELALWRTVSGEVAATGRAVVPPEGLAERTLRRIHTPGPLRRTFRRAYSLLRAQAYLIRREMWPTSAAVMVMGILVTFLVGKLEIIRFLAPLVAAASLAAIFGPEHDPACELTLATPTSPWKVLLARLTLVHAYNLALALAASLFLVALIQPGVLGALILGWLGPMTFLSALALLLSLWIGTGNSIAVAYGLWVIQYPRFERVISPATAAAWQPVLDAYRQFWGSPFLLIGLGIMLLMLALWSAGRSAPRFSAA
jgi:hypothetical protein